jgi:hypothetical protein
MQTARPSENRTTTDAFKRTRGLLAACVLVASIAAARSSDVATHFDDAIVAPTLVRVAIPGMDAVAPQRAPATVAISAAGSVALVGSEDQEQPLVTVIDVNGGVISQFGYRGEPTGELVAPELARFTGDTLIVYDGILHRVVATRTVGAHGKALFTRGVPAETRVVHLLRDSVDIEVRAGTQAASVRRVAIATGRGRDVIASSDTGLAAAALRQIVREQQPGFAFAGSNDRFLLGDPYAYELRLYSGNGTLLGTVRRDTMDAAPASDTRRQFSIVSGIQRDSVGRFWVIGQRGDSTFADVYDGVRFLGRTMLPCRAPGDGISLDGSWLALECLRKGTADDREVETQVYRIVEDVAASLRRRRG